MLHDTEIGHEQVHKLLVQLSPWTEPVSSDILIVI